MRQERIGGVRNCIEQGKEWEACESKERCLPLNDDIEKADIDFPNSAACTEALAQVRKDGSRS